MSLHRCHLSRSRRCKSHRQSRHVIQSLIRRTSTQSWYHHSCTSLTIDSIPRGFGWIQKLSIFHYAFEALIVNEMRYLTLYEQKFGLSVEVPGAAILRIFGFDALAFWTDIGGLAIIFGNTHLYSLNDFRYFYITCVWGNAFAACGETIDVNNRESLLSVECMLGGVIIICRMIQSDSRIGIIISGLRYRLLFRRIFELNQ